RSEEEYYDLEKAMTLRSAVIDRGGRILESHLIDSTVCDCCQTDLAPTARGAIAVYRNRTDGEIRDIQASRYQEGRWTEPVTVHPDGWKIGGCPVNGPAVASSGDHMLISWFTNSGNTPQVKAVFSIDGGQSFSDPVRIDDGNPLGRVDAALRPEEKSGFVSWMEKTEEGADFRYRKVGSERMESVTVSAMNASRSSGFPRMVLQNSRLLFAWTAIDSLPHVETAYYPLTNGH
ncbi:MAG: hypothetical protein R3211_09300, partial [Balneolaceae bacterium]|nr:hypothetical protein [Balneolaceae bacterium]